MKKILYFMHVDWRWIKQRPHFLAEGLSQHYKVDVWHEKHFFGVKKLVCNSEKLHSNLSIRSIKRFPFNRIGIIYLINIIIIRLYIRKYCKNTDIIWVPNPIFFPFFNKLSHQTLVYDCMDDMLGFNIPNSVKKRIKKYEERLITQADIVIASSEYLRTTLLQRYNIARSIKVINNAILPPLQRKISIPEQITEYFGDKTIKKIVYVGTISEWFDFNLLLESLEKNNKIEYLLFGPSDVNIPKHPKIRALGPIEHEYVLPVLQHADCLIMPFIVNELIKSVNPVKAYEYILAYKPAILPAYNETEKFKEYVYLYNSPGEYFDILYQLVTNKLKNKLSFSVHYDFAMQNTWKNRTDEIIAILN